MLRLGGVGLGLFLTYSLPEPMIIRIPLAGISAVLDDESRLHVTIDAEDYLEMYHRTWYASVDRWGKAYAYDVDCDARYRPGEARRDNVSMHREIAARAYGDELPWRMVVDHEDGDGLNNSRDNLRLCTAVQNARSRRPTRGRSLPKGVYKVTSGRYRASISHESRSRALGTFDTVAEAASAYDAAALRLRGDFAWLNNFEVK